ncbi:MAG TPA: STAS domain-containing protein [Myxococcales bacterium LLY-WYZ-16_1]|jgi:anti-anti-sigma factor|nr:STAS domain-containing protein [Myxococcales bacterium LLY-WYZ-16_1]
MGLHTATGQDGTTRITVEGRFDFQVHREFRAVLDGVSSGGRCVVDLSRTSYLDSSALGMLLLLRERCADVRVENASDDVRKVLEIANFQRLFELG